MKKLMIEGPYLPINTAAIRELFRLLDEERKERSRTKNED